MIIRRNSRGRKLELGASEVGPTFDMEGTKWHHEGSLKLPKMLADMFFQLCDHCHWEQRVMRELEVVGYLHGGKADLLIVFSTAQNYHCRLLPNNDVPR